MKKFQSKQIPDEVYLPLVASFFKEARSLVIGSVIVVTAMALCYVKTAAWPFALCAVAFLAVLAIRIIGMVLFNRANEAKMDRASAERWEVLYVSGATASVGILGIWCFLAFAITADPFTRLASFTLTMAYIIGVFGRNFGNSKYVTVQTITAWLPMTAALIIYGDAYHWILALLMVPLFLGMKFIAQRIRLILLEAITARLRAEQALENAEVEARVATAARRRVVNLLQRLRQSRRREQAAIATRDQHMRFLATMSHEIRTPLNGIVGALDILQTAPPEKVPHLIKTASLSAEALLEIVSEVLDLARLEYGEARQPDKPFKSREVLEFVRLALTPIATGKGLELNIEVDEDTPPCLIGDPGKIRQVLINLVGNSLKFTEAGSVDVTLRCLSTNSDRAALEFEVRDTGIGIDADDLNRIYDPFYTAGKTLYRGTQSSGLGLAIVKKTIESMNGSVTCESEVGAGTTFKIRLDLKTGDLSEQPESPNWIDAPAPASRPARILLVEDNDTNAMIVEDMLETTNHTVTRATGGLEAVQMATDHVFDIILMDISMPDLDGVEACHRIRRQLTADRHPKIVALTANAIIGDRERYLADGFDEYISKPIRKLPLFASIQKLIGQKPIGQKLIGQETARQDAQPGDSALDDRKFSEFLSERGPDRAQRLLGVFEAELTKHRDDLNSALKLQQLHKAQHSLHTIVGMSGSIGAMKLSSIARKHETGCRRGAAISGEEQKELFAEITATLAETSQAIRSLAAKVA